MLVVLRDKMSMASKCVLQLLQEGDVTGISRTETLFILQKREANNRLEQLNTIFNTLLMKVNREHSHQDGNDSFKLLLHKITNDLVVKILHRLPLENKKHEYYCI